MRQQEMDRHNIQNLRRDGVRNHGITKDLVVQEQNTRLLEIHARHKAMVPIFEMRGVGDLLIEEMTFALSLTLSGLYHTRWVMFAGFRQVDLKVNRVATASVQEDQTNGGRADILLNVRVGKRKRDFGIT